MELVVMEFLETKIDVIVIYIFGEALMSIM
jgi:hypothetical protein